MSSRLLMNCLESWNCYQLELLKEMNDLESLSVRMKEAEVY